MNNLPAVQRIGRQVVFVLHGDSAKVATARHEISVPLKSSRGIAIIRTGVPDPHDFPTLTILAANQQLARVADSTRSMEIA